MTKIFTLVFALGLLGLIACSSDTSGCGGVNSNSNSNSNTSSSS